MLYSSAERFIFVHIFKTGGESVVGALRSFCPRYFSNKYVNKAIRVFPRSSGSLIGWREAIVGGQHMTAEQIREAMPTALFNDCYKFTFVRNPWDWQVSQYFYMVQSKAHPNHSEIVSLGSFDKYIRFRCNNDVLLQSAFVFDSSGKQIVDFVGRFEKIQNDFDEICRRLELRANLPYVNATKRDRDWRKYYSDQTYDLVLRTYRKDIEAFGYSD